MPIINSEHSGRNIVVTSHPKCPDCESFCVTKAGKDRLKRQRYKCTDCKRFFTPGSKEPKNFYIPESIKKRCISRFLKGETINEICEDECVSRTSFYTWLKSSSQGEKLVRNKKDTELSRMAIERRRDVCKTKMQLSRCG